MKNIIKRIANVIGDIIKDPRIHASTITLFVFYPFVFLGTILFKDTRLTILFVLITIRIAVTLFFHKNNKKERMQQ